MKFSVAILVEVDEEENILPLDPEQYEDTVKEMITDSVYDVDGISIKGIRVIRK